MGKIKLEHVRKLVDYINKTIEENQKEPLAIFDNMFDICDAMDLDFRMLEYLNIVDFMKRLYDHKLLQWENISFTITDEGKIVFFKYIKKRN